MDAVVLQEEKIPGAPEAKRRSKAMRIVRDVVLTIVVVAALFAAVLYAGAQAMGYRFYEVTSPSMVPTFGKGDVVAAKAVAPHDIKAGDVIVFRRDGYPDPIVHRVLRVQSAPDIHSILRDKNGTILKDSWAYSERYFYTKGDGNPVEDGGPALGSQTLGVQRFVVPQPFNLIVTRLDRPVLTAVAAGCIALFVALEALDGVRALRRRFRRTNADTLAEGA
ncbi:MAG: signal peptidase I [Dehalococcoidia bacterium]